MADEANASECDGQPHWQGSGVGHVVVRRSRVPRMSERDVRFLMPDATRAQNPPPKLMKLVHTSDARQQNPMVTE